MAVTAADFLSGRFPANGALDIPCVNTSGAAISVGQALKLDTGNLLGAGQASFGVTPATAVTDAVIGFAVENAAAGAQLKMQIGGVAVGIALGAISAGAWVGASATAGKVTAYTATDPAIGVALSAATNANDPIFIRIAACRNA